MSEYGHLGWDVGLVGRWIRLVAGLLILGVVFIDFFGGDHEHSVRTNVLTALFFAGFVVAYTAAYVLIVDWAKDKSPWIPTVIFVLPAIYFSVVNGMIVPADSSFGYLIGAPYVNHPLTLAMLLYIGASFPVQFFTRYGGCEVIALQNLMYRKRCSSYCVPLLPIDFIEKTVVDTLARRRLQAVTREAADA